MVPVSRGRHDVNVGWMWRVTPIDHSSLMGIATFGLERYRTKQWPTTLMKAKVPK